MTSSQEMDRAYSNKKPQLPQPARGPWPWSTLYPSFCQQFLRYPVHRQTERQTDSSDHTHLLHIFIGIGKYGMWTCLN